MGYVGQWVDRHPQSSQMGLAGYPKTRAAYMSHFLLNLMKMTIEVFTL
jgi:hypothetical protein